MDTRSVANDEDSGGPSGRSSLGFDDINALVLNGSTLLLHLERVKICSEEAC